MAQWTGQISNSGGSGYFKTYSKLRFYYENTNGALNITSIQGCRTDGNTTASTDSSNKVNIYINNVLVNSASVNSINFNSNTNWSTFSGATAYQSGLSGSVNVTVTFTCSNNSNINSASFSTNVDVSAPSLPTYNVSLNAGIDSCTMSMNISDNPSNFWQIHWYNTSGGWCGCSGFTTGNWSYYQGGLSHNTTYNFYTQIGGPNDTYLQGSVARTFTTGGNAPTINSINPSVSRTSCSLASNSVSYDTNASYSYLTVEYGTTQSYGSTSSSTSITNLQPNTLYYYRMRVTDNWGRTSSWYAGSFTTTGNAPTINSINPSASRTSCSLSNNSVSYDTNASYSYLVVEYGTTQSYGSTSSSTSITNLQPNTLYYYRMRVTDNWGRTSSWYAGSFTTTGNAPTITNVNPVPDKTTCNLSNPSIIYDTNSTYNSVVIEYGTTQSYGNTSSNYILSNLQSGTIYYFRLKVIDNFGRTSAWYLGNFTTIRANSKIYICENNNWNPYDVYVASNNEYLVAMAYYGENNEWKECNE